MKPYVVTDDDRLWLLRAVAAEGAYALDVARALVNLFVWSKRKAPALTLETLVRSYAVPVNPRRAPGGDLFERENPGEAIGARRVAAAQRMTFPRHVVYAVKQALAPGYAYRSNVLDYAAPDHDATHGGKRPQYKPVTSRRAGVNRLWTRDASWRGYRVTMGGELVPADSEGERDVG